MRVLTLTNLYPNPWQPQRATFNRVQLAALGRRAEVRVIAPIAWTDELTARWHGAPSLPAARRVELDGLTVDHPRYWFPPKVLRSWYGHCYQASVAHTFARCVTEQRPDVVLAPWAYPDGWAAVRLARQLNIPVAIKVHGSDLKLLDRYPGRRQRTQEALRAPDAVIAVSRDLARLAIELGAAESQVHVLYDGVDPARFSPGDCLAARRRLALPVDRPTLLFIGNLVPVKGVDVLIRACRQLQHDMPGLTCHIIGSGPLRGSLEQLVARESLTAVVKFHGSVSHGRLVDWYRAADLFVLPSHSEGVPVVLLEAAACGRPFVASRVGGIPEIAHLAPCELVPAGDVTALATVLKTMFGRAASESLSPSQARPASLRTVDDAADELFDILSQLVADHRDPASSTHKVPTEVTAA